jgi:Tfp pilus assembly protein PilN
MKLRLNLSTAPQENRRPFLAAASVIGTLGIIALAILATASFRQWRANREIRADISRLEDQIRASTDQQADLDQYFHTDQAQKILERSNFLNSLIGERSFPWTKVFADLEETLPAGVRVVNIYPKLVNGQAEVILTIGAANDEQKIRFLEAIEKSKKFSDIHVTSERRTDQPQAGSAMQDRIVLDLKAVYATS